MLQVEDLVTKYGEIPALKGISFEVKEGEIVALIGANGAGKSTTLMTISGALKPSKGRIIFDGKEIQGTPSHAIVDLGILQCPEGRRLFTSMTVEENLLLGSYSRRNEGAPREAMRRVFQLFPILEERLHQSSGTLSGGERQMLAMGRALMAKPRLLMLDEPSLGLAPILVENVLDTIKQINQDGTTILLVEQNARAALSMADRAYALEVGTIALEGTGQELLRDERVLKAYLGGR
ncbi:MAG: ABC transporter ATP-binding protein [Anaerolineales bacterium]|nr:MAG: ABC transporter ATP-binding protein [Anaerolineales bacterium]